MPSVRMTARKKFRQLKRKTGSDEDSISHLNITAMMDMMTILVVFFLKNFAVNVENYKPSNDLMIPKSSTLSKVEGAIPITVTTKAILVEGVEVAKITEGKVDSSLKPGGSSDFQISPLLNELGKHATRLKKIEKRSNGAMKFKGEILLIADQNVPYRLLSEILYTAGQAEYGKYRLMVLTTGK